MNEIREDKEASAYITVIDWEKAWDRKKSNTLKILGKWRIMCISMFREFSRYKKLKLLRDCGGAASV